MHVAIGTTKAYKTYFFNFLGYLYIDVRNHKIRTIVYSRLADAHTSHMLI